jgi:hypothetical protein
MIIGFTGRKGAGKSAAAAVVQKFGFEPMSFAWTIKQMARTLLLNLGLDEQQIVSAQLDKKQIILPLGISYRYLCQTLGTEWGRHHLHPDVWVMVTRHLMKQHTRVVFDDVRFENEAAMIRDAGGLIVHIERQGVEDDAHQSEKGILLNDKDVLIFNNRGMDYLESAVMHVVQPYL